MLSTPIEYLITITGASRLTDIFIAVSLAIFCLALLWQKQSKHPAFTQYTPTLLTSLGILGTFMGIVAGLLHFDTHNIDSSISPLLEGLKTAFITSLVGILLAIFYKAVGSINGFHGEKKDQEQNSETVTGENLLAHLSQQSSSLKKLEQALCSENTLDLAVFLEHMKDSVQNIQKSIGSESDSSLVGQIKLLRQDNGDLHSALRNDVKESAETLNHTIKSAVIVQRDCFKKFEEKLFEKLSDFANQLSKSATEELIGALKSVIADFNTKLTEQFGENFKQLNSAVGTLVTWQENYRVQLGEMKNQFELGLRAITQTEKAVVSIEEKVQSIPSTIEKLGEIMQVNQHQIEELSRHLNAFEQVRDKAIEAIPEIENQVKQIVTGAQKANETMAKGVTESTQKLKDVVENSAAQYQSSMQQTQSSIERIAATTAKASDEIREKFTTGINAIHDNLERVAKDLQSHNKTLINDMIEGNQALTAGFKESSKDIFDNLKGVAKDLQSHNKTLINDMIEGNQALKAGFKESSKDIFDNLKGVAKDLQSHNKALIDELLEGNQALKAGFKESSKDIFDNLNNIAQEFNIDIESMRKLLGDSIEKLAEEQRQQAQKVFSGLEANIQQALSNTNESMKKSFQNFDNNAEIEVQKVMQAMGNALATISGQFTKDYQKLIKEMSNIMTNIPKKV